MYWNIADAIAPIAYSRLIETWDVLKCIIQAVKGFSQPGLIETWDVLKCLFKLTHKAVCYLINRNMRCIEIAIVFLPDVAFLRLIETWDVLKYLMSSRSSSAAFRLIETWDVLK